MTRLLTLCTTLVLLAGTGLSAQYQRTILIEDFSSVTCVNCPQASAIVTKLVKENKERAISLQYHLDIPGRNDPFYAMNKPHQDARAAYYGGFNSLPQVIVDGRSVSATNEADVRSEVNFQKGEESPIEISVTQSFEGGALKANVSVSGDGLADGYRLYVAAAEKLVERTREYFRDTARSQEYYNETIFHDLFRTFASPATGEAITFSAGATKNYSYTIPLGARWDPDEMFVIAWVQDEFDNTVVQTGFSQPANSVKHENRVAGYSLLNISPNPMTGPDLALDLEIAEPEEVVVEIYDVAGNEVARLEQGRIEAGRRTIDLSTGELPSGSYLVRVTAGAFVASRTVQVVR